MVSNFNKKIKEKENKRIAKYELTIENGLNEKIRGQIKDSPFLMPFYGSRMHGYTKKSFVKDKELPAPLAKIKAVYRMRFRASMTVEAAFVVPLFVFALTMLISIIMVTGVEMRVRRAVYESVRSAASVPYTLGRSAERTNAAFTRTQSLGAVKGFFMSQMRDYPGAAALIEGGVGGVRLSADYTGGGSAAIHIKADYNAKLPIAFLSGGSIPVKQEIEGYAWLGDEFTDNSVSERMVYITPHGSVYHEDINCTYLKPTVYTESYSNIASLRNAGGEKYRECEACTRRAGITPAAVYITRYGNRYHTNPNCVKIRHEVISVPLSQVGDRHLCLKEQGRTVTGH